MLINRVVAIIRYSYQLVRKKKQDKEEDIAFAYATELLSFGSLYKELVDAV